MTTRVQWSSVRSIERGLLLLSGATLACAALPVPGWASASPSTAWQLLNDGDPSNGSFPMAYDTNRQREVLLVNLGNGFSTTPQDAHPPGTWELVGEDWVRKFVPEPTPWYSNACMAFDQARGKTVLFGALGNDDTWEYDGTTWTKKTLTTRPHSRLYCGMVYDANRNKIVMFGGQDENFNPLGDTWEYDGTQWTQRTFNMSPSPRTEVALSYDSERHVTVLFGGRFPLGSFYRDTWEYDGTKWVYKNKNEQSNPSVRSKSTMAYDPVRHKTVLYGGYTTLGPYGDTWTWDGTRWTQVVPPQSPPALRAMNLVWDTQRQAIVGYGGEYDNGSASATWSFNGATWTRIANSGLPPLRGQLGLAYDPLRDALVLYGGNNSNNYPTLEDTDTWLYENGAWAEDAGAGTTTTGSYTPLAFDSGAGEVRGFGGTGISSKAPPDIHTLAEPALTWSSTSQFNRPDGRVDHPIAYAPELGGLMIFAGRACCFFGAYYDAGDTWSYNGFSFQQMTPPHSPPAREYHGMAYDSLRHRLIVYGGEPQGNDVLKTADTWSYDGSDWSELFAVSPPGARRAMSLAYDAARDRVVMLGNGPPLENVTWEFDGSSWVAMPTPFMPESTRCWTELAYDTKRQVTWLFGGLNCGGQEYSNDTWAYGPDPDTDGIVGGLDNCPNIANASQANADGDAAGDLCDCAPSDPGAWSTPQPVTGLALSGEGTTTLTWADQAAAIGPGVHYDVATGDLLQLRSVGSFAGATCLADQTAVASASDARVPGAGAAFYYLVRSRNACGLGSFGAAPLDAGSPCP